MKADFKVIAIQIVILAFTPLLSFCQNDVHVAQLKYTKPCK